MPLDDLPLHRQTAPSRRPGTASDGSSAKRWVVIGACTVVVAALFVLWWMSRAQPRTAIPAPTHATDVAVSSNRPKRQPMSLPALDQSDSFLRELVATLSRHPLIERYLATSDVVRSTVLAIEQIGDGRTPAVPLKIFRPASRLGTDGGAAGGRIDPRTYARWDSATASLVSINPADAAQLYVNVKPLFDDAYRQLGHPGGDFDASIVRAIQMLQDTPTVTGEPELARRAGYYEHVDPALRALPPVQKQFLLAGPDNRQKILGWLKRFATALDLKL
jgi:hypothetical protein